MARLHAAAAAAVLAGVVRGLALERIQFAGNPGLVAGSVGAPGVIVIQEWWGVTPQVEAHASKIADAGYRVIVPDIYKGKIGVDAEEAHHLMESLDWPGAIGEILAAAEFLATEGSPRIAVVGFCMGGALTLGALAKSPLIVAGSAFYGVNFGLFASAELSDKAVQAHFGAEDKFAGFADPPTAEALQKALPHAHVYSYPGVGHAFLNDSPAPYASFQERTDTLGFPAYDPDVAALAWTRLFDFFAAHLAPHSTEL